MYLVLCTDPAIDSQENDSENYCAVLTSLNRVKEIIKELVVDEEIPTNFIHVYDLSASNKLQFSIKHQLTEVTFGAYVEGRE